MATLIDTEFQGDDRVIAAWLADDVLIDPGSASSIDVLEAALEGVDLRAILLTHIHLDHAAATGLLARRFPRAAVYVHEIGAPHVIDPARLLRSAARLYGPENMERLWGEVAPVPADRITALSGGERVEGFDVVATPGHAAHHVAYLDGEGGAYVGDVLGVRIAPGTVTIMPTPPPEIDVEAWRSSIDALAERQPERVRLTHFGEPPDAAEQIEAARTSLGRMAALAREGRGPFLARIEGEIDDQPADAADRMRRAMPPEQVWQGLERYWRKREG